ncbi:SipW-dependent-type signal peptide-containing protein [Jannaschia sp. R86511]|uniref:SipW-dependent-type signal peptide-containing protein n=1 Tax=Jannaschia sp. R86511 TaxID=3093853 RepID=UPI0036D22679
MNRNVIKASLAGVAAVALLAGGTTYASWSDFHIDSGNTVGAGTLTLSAVEESGNGPKSTFDNLRLAPGEGKDEWVKVVSNDGDSVPDATLAVAITDYVGTEDGCNGNGEVLADADCADTDSAGEFGRDAQIRVTAYRVAGLDVDCGNNVAGGGEYSGNGTDRYTAIASTPLDSAVSTGSLRFKDSTGADAILEPGDVLCVGSSVTLPASSDNATQGDSGAFSIRFDLVQAG